MLVSFCLGSLGFINLQNKWGFWMLAFGFGVGGGLWGVLSNLSYIRFFGPNHLGESMLLLSSLVAPSSERGESMAVAAFFVRLAIALSFTI